MATLTEVSFYTRRAIKYGSVIFFILLISPAVWGGIKKLYLTLRPPPPPPPTVKYGKLPQPLFPLATADYKPELRLETVNGQLPKFQTVGQVYVVQINQSRLLEVDRFRPKANLLGFANTPEEQTDGQTFKFTNPATGATLTANVISGNLHYSINWQGDQTLLSGQVASSNDQLFQETKAYFQNLGLLAPDLADGTVQYTYFRSSGSSLNTVTSLSEANFVRVDLFRADRDKLPFVGFGPDKSAVNIMFSASTDRAKRVVDMNYQYSQIIDENFATYPLKSVNTAWELLQQGQGAIVQKGPDSVAIRDIKLAYYESEQPQQFLQPVFAFYGDGGFVGYVAAIDPKYLQ